MDSLSRNILSVLLPFSVLFSKPSWKKALTLLLGTLLCAGKRTVCSALRAMGLECEAGFSKYHHLLNRTEWSSLRAARILLFILLVFVAYKHSVVLLVDETLERRRGKKIKARGYYRNAVRSSQSQVINAMGLKWLVMAISLKSPMIKRALALPFFSVLEPSKKCDAERNRRHKTSLQWISQMVLQVRRWLGKARLLI
ncbi:MAG: transposase [Simkania sp.]|nr:transposase [Simkania sp.]